MPVSLTMPGSPREPEPQPPTPKPKPARADKEHTDE